MHEALEDRNSSRYLVSTEFNAFLYVFLAQIIFLHPFCLKQQTEKTFVFNSTDKEPKST